MTRERSMFLTLTMKEGGTVGFGGNQNGKIIDGLRHNLLSISQFCDSGYDVMFDKTNCTIINKNDESIIFKGRRKNNVYKINFSELVDEKVVCLLSVNDKKWLWHRKLGHANWRSLIGTQWLETVGLGGALLSLRYLLGFTLQWLTTPADRTSTNLDVHGKQFGTLFVRLGLSNLSSCLFEELGVEQLVVVGDVGLGVGMLIVILLSHAIRTEAMHIITKDNEHLLHHGVIVVVDRLKLGENRNNGDQNRNNGVLEISMILFCFYNIIQRELTHIEISQCTERDLSHAGFTPTRIKSHRANKIDLYKHSNVSENPITSRLPQRSSCNSTTITFNRTCEEFLFICLIEEALQKRSHDQQRRKLSEWRIL
ncbi:transmembrane protein, putative [Medicago truncatula]|uniref:Transmembrane protein, putative n=1 Tax=Medicago truncatula TaxID=3880 RepID=A0A072V026_MEDTR|nr:transmembrane protein, putative [Medicago truncatula]